MNEENVSDALHSVENAATNAINATFSKTTHEFIEFCKSFLTWENLFKIIGIFLTILVISLIFWIIRSSLKKILTPRLNKHQMSLVRRIIHYAYYVAIVVYVLGVFGIKLSAIWGAAGIAGVAVGFAAQTSFSNLISGLFILSERTMKIGDYISVDGVSGTIDSIGLLSVQIHNLDNQLIRIPNSSIINSNLQNNNFYDKRRMSFAISISYDTDMSVAIEELRKVPAMCPTVLKDPEFAVWYDGFGDSGINMTLAVWFNPSDLIKTKNDVFIAMKKVFDDAKIEIPYMKVDVNVFNG